MAAEKKINSKKAVIWGASGFALVVSDIIRLRKEFELAGYLDDINPERKGERFCNSVILGGREQLEKLAEAGIKNIILGFGDCKGRLELTGLLKARGFSLLSAIHPGAVIPEDVQLGQGLMVGAGVVIDPFVKVGESCVINRGALIGHESNIQDCVNIAPGVNIGGRVSIGKGSFLGIGSTVINNIKIGTNVVIGAGSVVVKDIPDNVVAYGIPAKVIRNAGE
jgi:sugar O-acyltransferase (sialic acid O-acetyltransferase NeuD family)